MIIEIKYYKNAEDVLDAHAIAADRVAVCHSVAEAEAALGLIERHG